MRRTSFIILIAFLQVGFLFFYACNEEDEENGCEHRPSDCVTTPYTDGTLSIKLTINSENPALNIFIYEGKIEDGIVYREVNSWTDSNYSESNVPLGDYSATVDYAIEGVTVTAVDGDAISSSSTEYCEGSCYERKNADLDLRFDVDAFKEFLSGEDEKCFIATAAFGTSLAPEVWTLRKFRDTVLARSSVGRAFVSFYYHYSPSVARVIARHKSLRMAVRCMLYPVVASVKYPWAACIVLISLSGIGMAWRKRRKLHNKTDRSIH